MSKENQEEIVKISAAPDNESIDKHLKVQQKINATITKLADELRTVVL